MNKTKKKLGSDSHDFNWVKAIEECSAKSEFAVLQSYIQKNVEDRNKTLVEDENCSFEFKAVSNEEFIVTRIRMGQQKTVKFLVVEKSIRVLNGNDRPLFDFNLVLNENCERRFIDTREDKELLRWQVARKALEELFLFGLLIREVD